MKLEEELKKIYIEVNEKLDKYFSPNGKKVFLALVCVGIIAITFLLASFCKEYTSNEEKPVPLEDNIPAVMDDAGIMPDSSLEKDVINIEKKDDKSVSFAVEDYGRSNPFMPEAGSVSTGYSLMAPPENLSSGSSDAAKVITTKVSGIMYEPNRPSAILNIEGEDYLVRSGDYINNYKVLSISKNLVTVQLGSNIYKAGVGEVISDGEINYNKEDNLEHKFGGAKI